MEPVYALLRGADLDFSLANTFNLDEYLDSNQFREFMDAQLFEHVNICAENVHFPAIGYDALIAEAGGIDLCILGIGVNGHIAFNEPGSTVDCRTRLVDLTENTIEANSRFFESASEVPRHAITMGIGTILESRRIVLMATGKAKAAVVKAAIEGPADPVNPASLLQQHPNLTFMLDPMAASELDV